MTELQLLCGNCGKKIYPETIHYSEDKIVLTGKCQNCRGNTFRGVFLLKNIRGTTCVQ